MKKYMKKIIVGILALTFLFIGTQSVFASVFWNTNATDCPGSGVGNFTTNSGIPQGGSNDCWNLTNVSASAGDSVNVQLYYHNTGNQPASNTKVYISVSPAIGQTASVHTFTSRLYSTEGEISLGVTRVTLSTPQALSFGSTYWYPNQTNTPTVSGSEIITSNGLSLGTINQGWPGQGSVTASFHVSNTTTPTVCQDPSAPNYLGALPCIYPQLCKDTSATNYNGTLPCTYPQLCKDTSANNYNGALPCTYPPKSCITTLSASRTTITAGESSLLSWTLADCTNASLYPTVGLIYSSGSQNVSPTSFMIYTLTASGANGTVTKTVPINVNAPTPTICQDYNASNYGKVLPCTYPPKLCVDTSATNYLSVLPCTYPQLCKDTSASNYGKVLPCTYPQLCKDTSASNYGKVLPCTYPPQLCKDTSASNYNQAIPCTYPSQLCKDTAASNYNSAIPCTYPPQLCKDTTANNYNSAIPCTYPPQQLYCQDSTASNYKGALPCEYPVRLCQDSSALNYRGALPCEYPVRICQDYNASNYGRSLPCEYPVRLCQDSTASNYKGALPCEYPVRICQDSSALNYRGALPCRYGGAILNQCLDQSASNYLSYSNCIYNQVRCLDTSATNYLAYSSCIYNQVRCLDTSATNYLAYNACVYNTYVNKNVVTTVATNITRNEAQINGYITNTTYYNANVYFNYGTTINLGSRTTSKTASGNSNLSDFLTGLSPNTIYFFQAVGESNTGTSKGSIEVFKTLGNAVVTPIIVQGTTIIGKASPVLLNISNKYQLIGAGDTVDYIVTYKNIGNTRLIRPMVQVVIPMNMTLINSSRGTYSVDTHTLSAPVEDLNPGQEGVIYLQARVDSIPLNNSQIVTTALLVYTNTNGAQENAMAYVFNEPSAGSGIVAGDASVLGASAFFGGFLSIGLIGWLLILLLVLIVILISRSYSKNNTSSESKTVTHTTTLQ